jgi:hypothetical protein
MILSPVINQPSSFAEFPLDLRFDLGDIDSRITQSRASSRSYWGPLGKLETASSGVLAIEYNPASLCLSSQSVAVGLGTKTIAIDTGSGFLAGTPIRITSHSDSSKWMAGIVLRSLAGVLRVLVLRYGGSGSATDWYIVECRGLLIEEAKTNDCHYSASIANWTLTACSASGTFTAPDGSSFSTILADGTAASHRVARGSFPAGKPGNTSHVYSAFVFIPSDSNVIRLFFRCRAGTSGQAVSISVSGTGASATFAFVSSSPFGATAPSAVTASEFSSEYVGNGIHRLFVTSKIASDTTAVSQIDMTFSKGATETVAGDANTRIGVWGFGVQQGSVKTSHIPTSGSAVTRAAETASMSGSNFSDWYSPLSGLTLVVSGRAAISGSTPCLLSLDDGTSNNRMQIRRSGSTGADSSILVVNGGASLVDYSAASGSASGLSRYAAAISSGVVAFSVSGSELAPSGMGSVPTVNQMTLGTGAGSSCVNGTILRVRAASQKTMSAHQRLSQL